MKKALLIVLLCIGCRSPGFYQARIPSRGMVVNTPLAHRRQTIGLGSGVMLAQAGAPGLPARDSFIDGSIPPGLTELATELLGIELAREELAAWFTGKWQVHDQALTKHIQYLASLLDDAKGADLTTQAALRRSVAVGRDFASYALALMICGRSPGCRGRRW